MSSEIINTLILTTILAVVVGAGAYVTKNRQPAEIQRLQEEEEAIRLAQAEVETLLQQEAAASGEAREALARIHQAYRVVILTTRVNPGLHGGDAQLASVEAWLERHGFAKGEHYDEVTHEKVPALVYIDDRALHFDTWDQALDEL